jgi:putative redox protein
LEAFVGGAAACSAMDVIHILKLKKQNVTAYRVEVDGEREAKGPYPRPFTSLRIIHLVEGDVDEAVLREAVESSDAKFCSAIATMRHGPTITSEYTLNDAAVA